ncbi:MAG TPA: hypothetical protein VM076_20990 [Gemmatimonadaceae bacterium]|nr:hypothetical protein [Gemmatimonadaceae bacterium]
MTVRDGMRGHELPVRVLLAGAVDYAGLFPPAQLDMRGAASEYASYLASEAAWALGTFVVSATRLAELGEAASALLDSSADSLGADRFWRVSAVLGADVSADVARVDAFHASHGMDRGAWWARVEAVELRASTPDAISAATRVVPGDLDRFVEVPATGDVDALVRAIGQAGAYAKIRTGGTSADAFPASADVVRFLRACVTHRVPFKATAGLHHPLRGEYPLTYAPDSARGAMYGFLNVMLATALLRAGADDATAQAALEEQSRDALVVTENGITWRGRDLPADALAQSREHAVRSFGSCSFREPIDDLASLGML